MALLRHEMAPVLGDAVSADRRWWGAKAHRFECLTMESIVSKRKKA
jgi:hypothetical protein